MAAARSFGKGGGDNGQKQSQHNYAWTNCHYCRPSDLHSSVHGGSLSALNPALIVSEASRWDQRANRVPFLA